MRAAAAASATVEAAGAGRRVSQPRSWRRLPEWSHRRPSTSFPGSARATSRTASGGCTTTRATPRACSRWEPTVATLGEYALAGASAIDWEDIAVGPGPLAGTSYVYVADIGDNAKARSAILVYRVQEPTVPVGPVAPPPRTLTGVAALTFVYPDGPHDAEALIVDPSSGELFIVTKEALGTAQVFRAPARLAAGSITTLSQVATVSLGVGGAVTGADVTPAGDVVGLRTYFSVVLFPRPAGGSFAQSFAQPSCNGAVASEAQGEAIGFTRDGRGYVTASEGASPALHRFVAP